MKEILFSILLGSLIVILAFSPSSFQSLLSSQDSATFDETPEIEFFISNVDGNGDMQNAAFFGGENFVIDAGWFSPLMEDDSVSGLLAFVLSSPAALFDALAIFLDEGNIIREKLKLIENIMPNSGLLVIYKVDLDVALPKITQFSDISIWQTLTALSFNITSSSSPFAGVNTLAIFTADIHIDQAHNAFIRLLNNPNGLSTLFKSIAPWIQQNANRRSYIFAKFPVPKYIRDPKLYQDLSGSVPYEWLSLQFILCNWFDEGQFSENDPIEVNLINLYHITSDIVLRNPDATISYILVLFPEKSHTTLRKGSNRPVGSLAILDIKDQTITTYDKRYGALVLIRHETNVEMLTNTSLFFVQAPFPPNLIASRVLSNPFPIKGEIITITITIENPSDFDVTNVHIDDSVNLQSYLDVEGWYQAPCTIEEGNRQAMFERIAARSSQSFSYKVRFNELGGYKLSDFTYRYFVDESGYSEEFKESTYFENAYIYVNAGPIGLIVDYLPLASIIGLITALIVIKNVIVIKNRRT